jgi:hypothetical protein
VYQVHAVVKAKWFYLKDVGLLTHECVSKGKGLRKEILSKTHHSPYIVHPESIKMYKDEQRSELDFSAKRLMVSQSGLTKT